jgi:serine/threonine protein kinase
MPETSPVTGRYEIVREIGRGGMAIVYLARQVDLDRLVALKELGALRESDPSFTNRFLREARLAGSMSHPNIVTVHDFFEQRGAPVIAMEYLRRGSLRQYVGALSLPQVGGVLEGLLAGLAHAETHGIVHRDLKPENLLVSDEGRVKIVDFGIAKATNDLQVGTFVTSTGIALGTPNYVAPEQAMAQEVGPWTDLYSVGIVTFELFAGRAPFADTPEPMAVLLRQVNESIPPLSEIKNGVHPVMSEWVEWLLAKDPADRPQSAREAWLDLDERLASVLGSGWLRQADLPQPDPAQLSVETTANWRPLGTATRSENGQNGQAALTQAATVMPQPQSWQGPSAPKPRRRGNLGRWRTWRAAVLAVVALASIGWVGTKGLRDSPGATAGPTEPTTLAAPATGDTNQSTPSELGAVASQYETAASNVAASNRESPTPQRAALVAALQETAAAYRKAEAAAARDDRAGYLAALTDAEAGKAKVEAATQKVTDAPGATPGQDLPSTQPPTTPASSPSQLEESGGCAGDEASDDPSDDSCDP